MKDNVSCLDVVFNHVNIRQNKIIFWTCVVNVSKICANSHLAIGFYGRKNARHPIIVINRPYETNIQVFFYFFIHQQNFI